MTLVRQWFLHEPKKHKLQKKKNRWTTLKLKKKIAVEKK
jgi:hypothetical protein